MELWTPLSPASGKALIWPPISSSSTAKANTGSSCSTKRRDEISSFLASALLRTSQSISNAIEAIGLATSLISSTSIRWSPKSISYSLLLCFRCFWNSIHTGINGDCDSQMSELFNRKCSIPGKIPSGFFNAMFGFQSGCWAMDAVNTKCLGLDGYFISLFNAHIDRYPLRLSDEVRAAVPSSWDPPAIARYHSKFYLHRFIK